MSICDIVLSQEGGRYMKKPRDPIEVGKTLRELRGIRVRTGVSRELHISYSMLCKLEDGRRAASDEMKERIAKYYGVSVGDIFYTNE